MNSPWTPSFPAVQCRVSRPTDRLDEIIRFYRDGLGIPVIASFKEHSGYDGVMFGLPSIDYHLEFTQHEAGSPCPAPSKDNLLVFYIPEKEAVEAIVARLAQLGFPVVEPENPYWAQHGATIEDPDGWRIVLQNTRGLGGQR